MGERRTAKDALLGMKAKYGDGLRNMNSLERYEELMNLLEEIEEEDGSIHHLDIVHPDLAACIEETEASRNNQNLLDTGTNVSLLFDDDEKQMLENIDAGATKPNEFKMEYVDVQNPSNSEDDDNTCQARLSDEQFVKQHHNILKNPSQARALLEVMEAALMAKQDVTNGT